MPTCPECRTGYPPDVACCPRDGATLLGELAFESVPDAVSPASEASDALLGATLADKFKITARLGHGGMGVVYQATHAVIGREVAVKVLHERYVERREVAARLMNEAKLASAIRNEHIVDIFDFGETTDGRTFVVMELLEGESLAQVIRRDGPLPEERAIRVCLQVSDALGAAHDRGIIHRDVKPENIFLSLRDGADFVKVLDFGISKAMRPSEDSVRLTHTGMVLGTPLYMSPEQARGEEHIDHRIDVYALGVILYECLTGEVPFRGSNYLGIISDVLSRVPTPPRQLRPDLLLSPSVEQVVLRAMARDRDARYPSTVALSADLRRVLRGEAIEATSPAPSSASVAGAPSKTRTRRRWVLAAMASAAALATAATAVLASYAAHRAQSATPSTLSRPIVAAAVAAPPPTVPAVAAPAPAPSPTVTVEIRSDPSGAEIRSGARRLGVAPQSVVLPRSDRPVHLSFHLPGYEDQGADYVPEVDGDIVEIALHRPPSKKPARHHAHASVRAERPAALDPPPVTDYRDEKARRGRPR